MQQMNNMSLNESDLADEFMVGSGNNLNFPPQQQSALQSAPNLLQQQGMKQP